jgi:hypothetical protein
LAKLGFLRIQLRAADVRLDRFGDHGLAREVAKALVSEVGRRLHHPSRTISLLRAISNVEA